MHITIHTLGSRGDIQPFIPLGLGLQRAGFGVRVASFEVFRSFIEGHGLEFYPIYGNPLDTMTSEAGQAWLRAGQNAVANVTQMWRAITSADNTPAFNDALEACRGSDAIIYSFMGATAYHVAEKLELPSIFALIQPFTRSRLTPSMIMPELPLGGGYNLLTHRISEVTIWTIVKRLINTWRVETLGLPALPWQGPFKQLYEERMPYLYGFSPSVVPRPADWPAWHHISGYWFLDRDPAWEPPQDLAHFLENGQKPISIGFGSMTGKDAENLLQLCIEAIEKTDQRAVLLGGWANIGALQLPETIFQIDAVPHDWLFPRVAAVVHHGGSGTTAAGIRAGIPSIVVPFFGDQPYWGRRVHALGVGPRPIQRKALTVTGLAEAILQAKEQQPMRERASVLGEKIRSEDGVGSAVAFISAYLRGGSQES
jgi:UDP:flavonoid glycosyltransferase YjiC (YdhE family)